MIKRDYEIMRIFLMLVAIIGALNLSAGNPPENGITAEISVGLSRSHQYYHKDWKGIGMIVDGRVGYQFNRHWVAGAMIKHENVVEGQRKYLGFGVYGNYRFNKMKRLPLTFFIDGYTLHSSGGKHGWLPSPPKDINMTEVGLVPGLSYTIPKTPLDVKLRYLFIGYNNENKYLKSMGGCLGRGDWIIDAGLRRLELGLAFTFKFPHK